MQAHILYSGMVQGVGFRYTFQRYATNHGLIGWVKNLPDGQVESRVEGTEHQIKEMCKDIEAQFDGYIQDKQISCSPDTGEFTDFNILY